MRKVVITGLGTFEVRNRVARSGRNPRTGEVMEFPEKTAPAFKPGKDCSRLWCLKENCQQGIGCRQG